MNINKIVISKKWDNPQICLNADDIGLKIEMVYSDFIKSLVLEMGNPTLLLTKKALEEKLNLAFIEVIQDMKEKTKEL